MTKLRTTNIIPDLIISKASICDALPIINFLNHVGGETDHLTFGLNEFPYSVAEEEIIIAECLNNNKCLMLVGKINEEIIAQLFLDISPNPRLSHIANLGVSVSKKYWGLSIGAEMIVSALQWARENNICKVQLQVRTDNTRAVALYKKLGFVIEGTLSHSIKVNTIYFDDYIMGLILTESL
jgi:RimJ/RimL family protein N-acetyltransferase